jgi:BASS family bile acid:Na+ symporter
MKQIYKVSLALTLLMAITAGAMILTGNIASAGPWVILFFIAAGIGVQGDPRFQGFSFGMIIFAMVATGLYYPQYFIELNGFQLSVLIIPLIQVIMFGMGTSMSFRDFVGVAKMPKGVFIGVFAQFAIMPLVGLILAYISLLPTEIAAGIILLGCCPGGMASNVMAFLAKANVALSITLTAFATLLAPFFTPVLMKLLAGEFIEIDIMKMMWDIVKMVIVPIGAGLMVNRILKGKAHWLHKAMPKICMMVIALVIALITAAGRDSLLEMGFLLILLALIHNISGFTLGYWMARFFGMNEQDCRTVALEVGMQNGGMALGLAKEMGKVATLGLAGIIFSSLHNITGSILAFFWHSRSPESKEKPRYQKYKNV